ncbi:MAG: hypothetical protein Q9170_003403 [Blastenia crenularia]
MNPISSIANRLEIALDAPTHKGRAYLPGDLVKGAIILHNPEYAAGVEASISFTGISRVHFKEKGRLFSPAQTNEDDLVTWSQTNLARTKQHGRLTWAFSVPIPSNVHTSMSRSWSQIADDERFAKYPGHTLPPSFGAPSKGEYAQITQRETADRQINIVYMLKATLTKPHFTHSYSGPTACQLAVPLSPPPCPDSRVPAFHVNSSMHRISPYNLSTNVLDNNDAYSHDLFWKTMKPYIHLHLSMPGTIIAGQPLDINVSFDHSFVQFAAAKLPPVILQSFDVDVNLETCARVPSSSRRQPQAKWDERMLSCTLDATQVPVRERSRLLSESLSHKWDIHSLLPELKTKTLDIPTFKTWNIALSYTIHVRGEVQLDKEKMRFDVKKPLIVLPDHSRRDQLSSSDDAASEGGQARSEGNTPPLYSDHRASVLVMTSEEAQPPSYQATLNEVH